VVAELGQPALDGQKPADDDERHWSVTTILGCLKAEGLLYWTAEEAAKAAVNSAASLQARIEEEGREAVIKWLRDARFRRAKGERTAAELGTEVHAACESYALTGQRPDVDAEVQPFLDQFDRWAQEFQPVYQAAEVTVYSQSYGYAGTCDAFLTVGGVRCIVDYKSSRKSFDNRGNPTTPYPEVALQLAAYRGENLDASCPVREEGQGLLVVHIVALHPHRGRKIVLGGHVERAIQAGVEAVERQEFR